MKKVFITYGDSKFEYAKNRILSQAASTCEFDRIKAYGPDDISDELRNTGLLAFKRGGGFWSWKPDIIYREMQMLDDGDYLVYCDSGCSLYKCKEWRKYWNILAKYSIIPFRIFKRNISWTRKEIFDYFGFYSNEWKFLFQFEATAVVLKVCPFTRKFVSEWRNIIIDNPFFVQDVTETEKASQHSQFIENRHDQSVYSSLIYKLLLETNSSKYIYPMWEHIEDYDIFKKQAIRATRLRSSNTEKISDKFKLMIKRLVKDLFVKPIIILSNKKLL